MTARHRPGLQLDLFIPYIADLPLRNLRLAGQADSRGCATGKKGAGFQE